MYWIVRSIVSMTPCPGWGGSSTRGAADDRLAGRARELGVEDALNTLEPALDPLEPDDVRRQLAVRVEAEGLGQEAESGLAQRPDRGGDCGRELPPEPDERARARQSRVHLRGRQANDRRQPRGDAHGVADAPGLDEERLGRRGGGEWHALAVEDRAALGVEG